VEISNELNEVFFRYPFSVPPFFALVTRGLGLLEGIALSGDPDFDIFQSSAPFARRQAIRLLASSSGALVGYKQVGGDELSLHISRSVDADAQTSELEREQENKLGHL
jgi:predicted unusual protein kinase regulating ubiquinone biosynthesis (AarF/ABC1/UbiB family)